MITTEELKNMHDAALTEHEAAENARDEMRELIEQLDTSQIQFINTFTKRIIGIDEVEPHGGDLCGSYRNGIREEIAHCNDVSLLDLIWKILAKSLPH